MLIKLGQKVLVFKSKVSHDNASQHGISTAMADKLSESEQKLAFINRVRTARMARFPTQRPMLTILDIEQGTYKWYESRTPLPHRYIPKFCAATGVSIEWLLTGEGPGPIAAESPVRKRGRPRKLRHDHAA
jgi:hypothetical protein